jgi:hypothetical protein
VLKAQVYLGGAQDRSAFDTTWEKSFDGRVPPTTVVPVRHPAFLTPEATVEINVIAAHRSARSRVKEIESDVSARVLDGLVFTGGFHGNDLEGILQKASRLFAAAGATIVRAIIFHSGREDLSKVEFPFTAVEVQGGLTVDLWGYAPQGYAPQP